MTNYKMIQLTNTNVGAVAQGNALPFGVVTRKVCIGTHNSDTFIAENSGSNMITINDKGYYSIDYNASLIAAADGNITISLILNGDIVYTTTATVVSGATANLSLSYITRIFANCNSCPTNNPANIQIILGGVAITDGESNIQIVKVY